MLKEYFESHKPDRFKILMEQFVKTALTDKTFYTILCKYISIDFIKNIDTFDKNGELLQLISDYKLYKLLNLILNEKTGEYNNRKLYEKKIQSEKLKQAAIDDLTDDEVIITAPTTIMELQLMQLVRH